MAILAGLQDPTRAEIEDELPRLFHEIGVTRPTWPEAFKIIVDDALRRIVSGTTAPYEGARELWSRSHAVDNAQEWHQLEAFVGLASQCEDDPAGRSAYETDIVAEAQAMLDDGGVAMSNARTM